MIILQDISEAPAMNIRLHQATGMITLFTIVTYVSCVSSFTFGSQSYHVDYSRLDHCLLIKQKGEVIISGDRSSCAPNDSCEVDDAVSCGRIFASVDQIFLEEPRVEVIDIDAAVEVNWLYKSMHHIMGGMTEPNCTLALIIQPAIDRGCLMTPLPTQPQSPPHYINISTDSQMSLIVDQINQHCHTFRRTDGELNKYGLHEQYIKDNLYSVSEIEGHVKSEDAFSQTDDSVAVLPTCEKIKITSWNDFFIDYLQISKPVIISNAISHWNASMKWTNDFLRRKYGNKSVHIKLSPSTEYEGIESADLWDQGNGSFRIPDFVLARLPFPDLVVPRPATANMKFSDYIDLMEGIGNGSIVNASAYLEYSSIPNYFPDLRDDITEMPFLHGHLAFQHLNIWLSDGNTVGKLHFDPFDNFLCMIDGKKELTIFEPHDNTRLYEAHIPETKFSVDMNDMKNLTFRRDIRKQSTSMVMSPFDITKPDFERFPLFKETAPLNCTIEEGEVLFMPAFWWHEVRSSPNPKTNRNLAINYWYEPFLTKPFPCPECKLNVNPKYFHLL